MLYNKSNKNLICANLDNKQVVAYAPHLGLFTNSLKLISSMDTQEKLTDYLDRPEDDSLVQGFIFVVTRKCNLRCNYCYSLNEGIVTSMGFEEPKEILKKFLNTNSKYVFINFFGGEPTLSFDVIKATVNYAKKLDKTVYFRITTNGLMSAGKLDYLIDNGFSIVISSDGAPQKNSKLDKIRVANSVEKSIKRLVDRNTHFRIRCTITSENITELSKSIKYWRSLGIKHIHLEPYNPADNSEESLRLLPESNLFIKEFEDALDIAEENNLWVQNGIFMNLLTPSTYFCTGAAGKYNIYNPDGLISSCYRVQGFDNEFKNFMIGNWRDEEMDQRNYRKYSENLGVLRKHSVEKMNMCASCKIKMVCGGGCLMRNYSQTGDIRTVDPWICKTKKVLLTNGLKRSWKALEKGKNPIIFGRNVFENKVIENPAIGTPPKLVESPTKEFVFLEKNKKTENYYDIYKMLKLKRYYYNTTMLRKISRAECI